MIQGETRYLRFSCGEERAVENCAEIVKNGGVIVYPTDTVYGIGCDPFNEEAIERIFRIKHRVNEKALPVLASSLRDLERIVEITNSVKKLARKFWPGPLTIICPLIDRTISPKLTANSLSLAVRIPDNLCTLSLLKFTRYLVGTSANISGQGSIKSPTHLSSTTLADFDAVLDGGTLNKHLHSTVIRLDDNGTVTIARNGPVSEIEIKSALLL